MEAIQRKSADTAIKLLMALKDEVQWSVQIGGEVFGNAQLAPTKLAKRKFNYPRNETVNYFRPFVSGLGVGDVVKVPTLHYDGGILATHISAFATREYGKGNYTTHKNDKEGCIEFMRLG